MKISSDPSKYTYKWRYLEIARYIPQLKRVIREKKNNFPILLDVDIITKYSDKYNNTGIYSSIWHFDDQDISKATRLGSLYFDIDNSNMDISWQEANSAKAPITSLQNEFSLLARNVESDALDCAINLGRGFIAWSPLGRGALTGKYRQGIPADSRAATPHFAPFIEPYLNDKSRRIVEAVSVAAQGLGYSPLEVALAWVRDFPGVTSAVVGARTGAQMRGILVSEEIALPEVVRSALNEISL